MSLKPHRLLGYSHAPTRAQTHTGAQCRSFAWQGEAAEPVSQPIVRPTSDVILFVKAEFSGVFTAELSVRGEMMPHLCFFVSWLFASLI